MKKTYTKAVSATLASALAVGMVPAMALADDAQLETLAGITVDEAFSQGQIVEAQVNGEKVALDGDIEFIADGVTSYNVQPTKVLPLGASAPVALDYTGSDANATITYFKVDATQATATEIAPGVSDKVAALAGKPGKKVGTYYAVVTYTGDDYLDGKIAIKYSVINQSLENAFAYQPVVSGTEDYADKTFVYSGDAMGLQFAIGTTPLASSDYSVDYYVGDTTVKVGASKLIEPGSYRAVLTGKNEFAGSSAEIPFEIVAYNLAADANIAIASKTVTAAAPTLADVVGLDLASTDGLQLTFKSATNGKTAFDGTAKGAYTYTLSVAANADASVKAGVTGTKDITFNVCDTMVWDAGFTYNGSQFGQSLFSTVDLSDADGFRFDKSKVAVKCTDSDGVVKKFTADEYDIVVTNAVTLQPASVDDINTPGVWNVQVVIDSAETDYVYTGDSAPVTITTIAGTIDLDARAYVYYGSQLVTDSTLSGQDAVIYDGKSVFDELSIVVKNAAGTETLTAGTDYKLKIMQTAGLGITTSKEVTDIVDAGTYEITFENGAYVVESTLTDTITVKVSPVETNQNAVIRLAGAPSLAGADNTYGYTGEPIDVALEYDLNVAPFATKEVWNALDADAYKIAIQMKNAAGAWVAVDEVKEAGEYKAIITDNAKEGNFDISGTILFEVSKDKFFLDVPTSAWYHNVVWQATAELGYMNGYAGTQFFGPNDTLTRAQLVCVLYNIAGGGADLDEGTNGDYMDKYESFKDVASNKFYSEAVYWAKQVGVVNGYDDGTFKPEKAVSREEAAAMFANFAAIQGEKVAAADVAAALAAYPDGAKVSNWAKGSVAWAVENGVMGNGKVLNPTGSILRAEAAAYAVNYYNAFIAE